MAKREVIWSKNAEIQLQEILEFFFNRNKSGTYSRKLYKKLKSELVKISKHPELVVKTKLDQVRGLIVDNYIVFYEIIDEKIVVLRVWDTRQDPNKLII